MLISLSIRNIALMDEMQAEFTSGLHVLTGETGAGKSILVDAVVLLLGGRAQKELIRTGETKARVEGVFDISDCPAALQMLREQELDDGDSLILCREITSQGRSSCRVNGTLLPLSQYQLIAAQLMDIHGQHEHQSLMDDKKHLGILDATGGEAHRHLMEKVQADYRAWHECRRKLEEMRKARQPKYLAAADAVIDNNAALEGAAERAREAFYEAAGR